VIRFFSGPLLALLVIAMAVGQARAQYSAVSAPFGLGGSSFSENIGIGWGFSGRNFFFNNGGAGALPPFGGHDPGADASLGFNVLGKNGSFSLGLHAGQGSSTSFSSETPTIVLPNGAPGALFSGQQRPFVTGVVPVVGAGSAMSSGRGGPYVVSPLAERLSRLRAEQALRRGAAQDANRAADAADWETPARPAAAPSPPKDDPPLILGGSPTG
jgi:hypothetical protein